MIKVKDRTSLMRDPNTGAIINTDNVSRKSLRESRLKAKAKDNKLKEFEEKLDNMETKLESFETKLDTLISLLRK